MSDLDINTVDTELTRQINVVSKSELYNYKGHKKLEFQSIIIPIHNGSKWIDGCFNSILQQTAKDKLNLEVCICNDASTDNTAELLSEWEQKFNDNHIKVRMFTNTSGQPKGGNKYQQNCICLYFMSHFSWVCQKPSCRCLNWKLFVFPRHCK